MEESLTLTYHTNQCHELHKSDRKDLLSSAFL